MFRKVVILFSLSVVITTALIGALEDENRLFDEIRGEKQEKSPTFREHFKIQRLIDFESFKSLYERHYESFAEEMVRRKLYLGRALRAFVSAVNYKFMRLSSYLKINNMSDWTEDEIRQIYMEPQVVDQLWEGIIRKSNLPSEDSPNREPVDAEIVDFKPERVVTESNGQSTMEEKQDRGSLLNYLGYIAGITVNQLYSQVVPKVFQNRPDSLVVDHRDSPCYQPVRDQGRCGSCYAFATIALYEWLFCRKTGELIEFSEQYVVDCGDRTGMRGCKGGKFSSVSDFTKEFGLDIRENYPYLDKEQKCPYEPEDPKEIMGFIRVQDSHFVAVPISYAGRYLYQNPFVINMRINRDFSSYGGGVDDMKSWEGVGVVHTVLVIGEGIEGGENYWLIRNSKSKDFGEDGHYKLNKKTTCLYPDYAFILRAKFERTLEESLNKNYNKSRMLQED